MVNNSKQAIVRVLALLLVLFSFSGYSQKISKHYSSAHQQNGTLYFIFEQNDFRNSNSDFKYDLTYLSTGDSAFLNYSIIDKANVEIDSISLVKDSFHISNKSERIFIEKFYGEGLPKIILYSKKGEMVFTINKGAWKNQSELVNKIFMVIKYNK